MKKTTLNIVWKFGTILADPPCKFDNRTGKIAHENKKLKRYKTNIIWNKVRKDGEPDGRGVGFYFRNTTEIILFGTKGQKVRTLKPGRSQVNLIKSRKREHSRKPDELYKIIEKCSWGPYLELIARGSRKKWTTWGNQSKKYKISWKTYTSNSQRAV